MNIETYFEEQKGITVDAARNAGARYTAIDICRFAKKYHESKVKNLDIQRVVGRSEQLINFLITVREEAISSKTFEEAGRLLKELEKIN